MSNLQKVLSSTALLSLCRLNPAASFRDSVHLVFGIPHFLLPSTFLSMMVGLFQRILSSQDVPKVGNILAPKDYT